MPPRLGPVHLSVAELDRSLAYYEQGLGLGVRARNNGIATLGGASDLLVLHEQPGARPAGNTAGLFHFALLVPSRAELARSLARLHQAGMALTGASDHLVSEALYLRDPDGHGIEIYRDRPSDQWPRDPAGRVEMATLPLDLNDVLSELGGDEAVATAIDPETVMGHVHLQVGDLASAAAFATGVLGLETQAALYDQAQFLSWDSYHHHVGMNTWAGRGIPPAPPETARLLAWTAHVTAQELDGIRANADAGGISAAGDDDGTVRLREPASGVTVALRVSA